MTPFRALAILALPCLIALPGCKASKASNGLPPARGSAAAPLPVITSVDDDSEEQKANDDSTLRATGSTYAIDEAELGPKSSGVLTSVRVDEGNKVKKGQLLFTLDAAQAALMVEQAKASLQAAEVAQSRAQLDFDRTRQLFDKGAVAPAMYDQARLGLDQAAVGVTQAQVGVSTAKRILSDSVVVSPLNGVVSHRYKHPGETVTMMPPTTVLVIQDLSKVEVRVRLPEGAMGRVHAGDPMTVNFRALKESVSVPVARINPSIDAQSRTLEVVAEIDNAEGKYKSGMLVECEFAAPIVEPTAPASSAPSEPVSPSASTNKPAAAALKAP